MSYEVKDTHHNIIINLTTNDDVIGNLELHTYVNGSNNIYRTYPYQNGKFTITMGDYTVGDIITKFEVSQTGDPHLWETHEGVQVLINGANMNIPITPSTGDNATFDYDFTNTGLYDIQCVYVGNGSNQVAKTEKKSFIITQESSSQQPSSPHAQSRGYTLDFVKKTTPKLKYNDGTVIEMVLKKDGVPAKDRVVQCVEGDRDIDDHGTRTTNSKGIVRLLNNKVTAGTWDFGAFYYDEVKRKTIKKYRKVTIEKLTATMTDNFVADKNGHDTNFIKGSKYVVTLKLGKKLLTNQPIDMFVNGKKIPLKTDKNGTVAYGFKTKDTFKIKTVYKGTKNIGSVELTRSITISE